MIGNYVDTSSYFTVYPYGEVVLGADPSGYYIWWDTVTGSQTGTFTIEGVTYNESDYSVSQLKYYFYGFNGTITESAFISASPMKKLSTNALVISSYAFAYDTHLSSLSLPNCISIGDYAFYARISSNSNYTLKRVNLPACQYIGNYAFGGSRQNLQYLTAPVCSYVASYAFASTNIRMLSLPKCKYVGYRFVYDNAVLSGVSLPECEYIESYAFESAGRHESISTFYIPKCKYIGSHIFYNGVLYLSEGLYLPECEYIGEYAFEYQRIVLFIDLPKCSYVGAGAFRGEPYVDPDMPYLRYHAPSYINLPECKYIGGGAFYYCRPVSSICAPKCEYIGGGAFGSCSHLTSINLPSCKTLDGGVFRSCTSLSLVSLPVCEYVGSYAFENTALSQITLPVCSYIERVAFFDCSNLTEITLRSTSVCGLRHSNAFEYTPIGSFSGTIYVPYSLLSDYRVAPVWSYFASIIQPINN